MNKNANKTNLPEINIYMEEIIQMKTQFKNKRAFTLIELLIVIAIIGILFIVLVSKVDFATDKAKATGVQTDFRSFQTAFEQVARENSGYATLGWDTGDLNGDRVRNSYDKGDKECGQSGCTECKQDGVKGPHEVWVGSKTYGETWNEVFTLVNPADNKDSSAFVALENAINANLDPKLHITITPNTDASGNLTGSAAITMANQARDPWKNEYAGAYITNATVDNLDRGSIIMYSTGANGNLGVNYSVSGGLVGVEVPGSNINGKDDYVLSVTYSYANGYGEVQTGTAGFSNNQNTLTSNPIVDNGVNAGGMSAGTGSVPGENETPNTPPEASEDENKYQIILGNNLTATKYSQVKFQSNADYSKFVGIKIDGNEVEQEIYDAHYRYFVHQGSTIITLIGSYVESLGNGTHEIEIISEDGSAKTTFTLDFQCEHEAEWDVTCIHCGDVYCPPYTCEDMNDDKGCDWCGYHGTWGCYDDNQNGYCDLCNETWCYDEFGEHRFDIDQDGDCHCDCCDDDIHVDNDKNGLCDNCYVEASHINNGNNQCANCGVSFCSETNYTDICYEDMWPCHCERCGEPFHVFDEYDQCVNCEGWSCPETDYTDTCYVYDCICERCGRASHDWSGNYCYNCNKYDCELGYSEHVDYYEPDDGMCDYCGASI
jgi:prepilin-type N-terminal cleavage/methylation domain-containing protein